MTATELPPGLPDDDVRLVPSGLRRDALQEAWVAHCSGDSPRQAVWRFVKRERRRKTVTRSGHAL